jgi:hypothetical protein
MYRRQADGVTAERYDLTIYSDAIVEGLVPLIG